MAQGKDDPFEFRKATPADDSDLIALFNTGFSRTFRPDWWNWFYYHCPYGMARTYVAIDKESGRLAASYSMLPLKAIFNGRPINASLAINANTHPDFRGRGLFVNLSWYNLSHEEIYSSQLSFGVPNSNAYPGHLKVGWETPSKLPFLAKHDLKSRPHKCSEISAFTADYDEFIKGLAPRFNLLIYKDSSYMNWRFFQRPDVEYTVYAREREGRMAGFIVLKQFADIARDYRKAHILDVHAENPDVLHELLDAAESYAVSCDELNVWSIDHNPYEQTFLDHGFIFSGEESLFITRVNYGSLEPLAKDSWWFCLGDNDVY